MLEMLYHCYLRYQMWKNFPNENGEIISIYINESYIGIDYLRWWSVPRLIKHSSWGSCTYANRLSLTKSQAIQEFFFQYLSFQSYHVIQQQELNTLKHWREPYIEKHSKIEEKMIFFYSMSLKYTTQAHSYKNHVFLGLKYMPA